MGNTRLPVRIRSTLTRPRRRARSRISAPTAYVIRTSGWTKPPGCRRSSHHCQSGRGDYSNSHFGGLRDLRARRSGRTSSRQRPVFWLAPRATCTRHAIPVIYPLRIYAAAGGLMSAALRRSCKARVSPREFLPKPLRIAPTLQRECRAPATSKDRRNLSDLDL
jgi:hypothetical protein